MISKILVPTDGSKTSYKAAVYAIDLAKKLHASIIAITVIDKRAFMAQTVPPSKSTRKIIEPIEDYLHEAAEAYIKKIKKMCDNKKVAAKIFVKWGSPVAEIEKAAKKSKADLIIMGSRGRSALSATVLGSVSYGVIQNTKGTPVLIVRG